MAAEAFRDGIRDVGLRGYRVWAGLRQLLGWFGSLAVQGLEIII